MLELARDSLEGGETLRLKVTSRSMSPGLETDDWVIVKPLLPGELARGDIVVYERDGLLITHRLIGQQGDLWLTKGDWVKSLDAPVSQQALVGLVIAAERNHQRHSLRTPLRVGLGRVLGWLGLMQVQAKPGRIRSGVMRNIVWILAYLSR